MANKGDLNRFMEKVDQKSGDCWEWTASKKGGGYGAFYLNGKLHGAHRASLFLFRGIDLTTPMDAMHLCDNPGCVNPDHISYGTRAENMVDASVKGRIVRVQDWRGSKNPKAKLSPGEADEIVAAAKSGMTRKEAGINFGVSDVRIGQILKAAGLPSNLSASEAAKAKRLANVHCKKGHPLSGANLRINSSGARVCRQCERQNTIARKNKAAQC